MGDLVIPEPWASRIRELTQNDALMLDDILDDVLYHLEQRQRVTQASSPAATPSAPPPPVIPEYPPRPAWSLTNADIDIPDDITDEQDQARWRQAERNLRPKLYEIAREYWTKVRDTERLTLTDEQLDKLFWLIDHEGIPRFKSELGSIVLPPDPLETLIGAIETDQPDLSMTVRESVAEYFRNKYGDSN
ncbi:MAG: hypothetical protein H7X77_08975 [Anaerolineae bacterium]|nr:hypothetical protein [Anaerolineae bacterium]